MAVAMPTSPHPAPCQALTHQQFRGALVLLSREHGHSLLQGQSVSPLGDQHRRLSPAPSSPVPPTAHLSHTPSPACPATPAHPAYTTVPALPASHPQLTGPTPPAHLPLLPFILLLLPEALNVLPLLSQGLVPELLLRTHLGSCLSHEFLEHNREGKRSC